MGIKELKEKMKADKAFAEQFKDCKSVDEFIAAAKKAGYDVKEADLKLTDEELSAVAGGAGQKDGGGFLVSWDANGGYATKDGGGFLVVWD